MSDLKKIEFGGISPRGWLKDQLVLQAEGLTGNIDRLWYDLSGDSAWLSGKGEAWERGPYYLDGLIPLAYILDDKNLIEKAQKWVECILKSQKENGFFGPVRSKDWWSRSVVLKALIPYYEATKDKRILTFFKKYFHYQIKEIDNFPFIMWATARAFEEYIPLKFYMDETGDSSVMPLAEIIKRSSLDWFSFFGNLPYTLPAKHYLNKTLINIGRRLGAKPDKKKKYGDTPIKEMSKKKINALNNTRFMKKLMFTHGVNVAMALKYPILYRMFDGKDYNKLIKKGIEELFKRHGTANGMFTSDEHLDGAYPHRGTELCTVAEMMYSLFHLIEKTGDPYYADLMELVAYNAFPATFTADMGAHQYLQQVNQISATVAKRDFFDVGKDANIFGLEPNFGCCAANMHQGFPKFTESLCYKTENGLSFMVYAPCGINTEIGGRQVSVTEETGYPFKNRVTLTVNAAPDAEMTLEFRVPAHTVLTVGYNSHGILRGDCGVLKLTKTFKKGDKVELVFNSPVVEINNPDGSVSYRRGSLLLATKLEHKKIVYKGSGKFADVGYITGSEWNLAPDFSTEPEVKEYGVSPVPFDENNPPLEVILPARKVTNWKIKKNSAPIPSKPEFSDEEKTITLVPYGCTRIRLAQYPKYKPKT